MGHKQLDTTGTTSFSPSLKSKWRLGTAKKLVRNTWQVSGRNRTWVSEFSFEDLYSNSSLVDMEIS